MKLQIIWSNVDIYLQKGGNYNIYVEKEKSNITSGLYFVFYKKNLISLNPLDGYNKMRQFLCDCEKFDNRERWGNIEYVYLYILKKLNTACYVYYYKENNLLNDELYDGLEKQLIEIENKYPELISEFSPTQRVTRNFSEQQLQLFTQYLEMVGM